MGEAEGDLKIARGVGHGIILVLFCYLIINFSQFFAWFGWSSSKEYVTLTMCPVNLSTYLFYESISSVLYFILSSGIIASAIGVSSSGLNGKTATFFMVIAMISGFMRVLYNSMACYWIDTYPRECRNSPIFKMALASVILFFIMNVPVVLFHGRLILEKIIVFLNTRFPVPHPHLKAGINLKGLVNSPKYSDVMFEVDGAIFFGHKVILSSRCEYFSKLLYGGMKESLTPQLVPISIKEISSCAFSQILEFIYTDEISTLDIHNLDDVLELMRCVDLLNFNNLKDFLEMWLEPKITTDNIVPILLCSRKYNFGTESIAIAKLAKLKPKLREKDAVVLKEEPDLMLKVVEVLYWP